MRLNLYRVIVLLGIALPWCVGCTSSVPSDASVRPSQIGEPRERDTADMGAYEAAVSALLDHMADTVMVLRHVQDSQSSEWAAGLVDQARPNFVELRRAMQQAEPDKAITYPELVLNYGGTYLWTTLEIENELRRIKQAGPGTLGPVKSAMLRLKQELGDAGLPTEP